MKCKDENTRREAISQTMPDSRVNRDSSIAKNRNWREQNDKVNRFVTSLASQLNQNHRRGIASNRIDPINSNSSSRTGSNSQSTGTRSSNTNNSNNETSSSVRNDRIGSSSFTSSKQVSGKRLTTADLLRMRIDTDRNNAISLEEVLLYVLGLKSRNQEVPKAAYALHPKFADVVQAVEIIDSDESLDIEDQEAAHAIIAQRAGLLGEDLDMEVADFVMNYLNDNIDGMKSAAEIIDTNPDGIVSNIEVLGALLAGRRGELNLNDPNVDAILRTNPRYDQLAALVASMSFDFNGNVTDEQAFDIILALRAAAPNDAALQQALFLGTNDHISEIENSVALFDSIQDGSISNDEFINVIKSMRAGDIDAANHNIALNILRAREPYSQILAVIEAIDTEVDGQISDDEVIDFTLASLRGDFNLDPARVETIINSNDKVAEIRNLINQIDTEANNQGIISEDEFIAATMELINDASLGPNSRSLIEKIISRNPNSAAIYQVLNFIDSNHNRDITRTETINALLAQDRGQTSELDQNIFDKVLDYNPERETIETLLNQINPTRDGDPSLDQIINFVLNFKSGNIAEDANLVRDIISAFPQAQAFLETYELMDTNNDGIDLREYTSGLMQINKGLASNPGPEIMAKFTELVDNADIINEAITSLDTIEVNGVVSAEEFYQNFNQLFMQGDGTVDMNKLNIFMTVSDIIFPGGNDLFQFIRDVDTRVETPVNIISDTEVIDALLNLNNHSIADPGAEIVDLVLSRNPDKLELSNLVQTIDADNDGEISNVELVVNLLKSRRGEFSQDPGLVQYILNKNPKFDEINDLINAFDKDANGDVGDLELFAELFANRTGSYAGLTDTESAAIITRLKATNPNAAAIQAAVSALDPDASGNVSYNELVAAYLAINSGSQADINDTLKEAIPKLGGGTFGAAAIQADSLVDQFDSNQDGSISDIELALMILSDRANDSFSSYDPALLDAIFQSNGNKDKIEALINQLDGGDGEIDRSDLITAIMSQRADANSFGADYPLVEAILSASNNEFTDVNSVITRIDTADQGEISNQEAINTLVAIAKSQFTDTEISIANSVIDSNSEIAAIRTAFTNFGIDFNSDNLTAELFNTWVQIQQGLIAPDYFNELINALGADSDISNLISQFQEIDIDGDNHIAEAEYTNLMIDVITGNKVQADYQLLIDALASDPVLAQIRNIVNSFNQDGDAEFNDQNIVEGILALNASGNSTLIDANYVQAILAQNPDSAGIVKLISITDPDRDGNLDRNAITALWLDVIRAKTHDRNNPSFDFNGDGVVDNKDKETVINLLNYINSGEEFTILH